MLKFSDFLIEAAGKAIHSNTGSPKTKGHIKRYIFPYLSSEQKKKSIHDLDGFFDEKDVKDSNQENNGVSHDPEAEFTHELSSNHGGNKKGDRVKVTGIYRNGITIMARTQDHGEMPLSKLGTPAELAAANITSKGFSVEEKLQKHADPTKKPAGSTKTAFDFSAGDVNDDQGSVRGKLVKDVAVPEKAKKDTSAPIIRGEAKASKKGSVAMGTSELEYDNATKKWRLTNPQVESVFSKATVKGVPLIEHLNRNHPNGEISTGFTADAHPGTAVEYLKNANVNSLHLHTYAEDNKGGITKDHGTTYTVGDNNPFQGKLGMAHLGEDDLLDLDGKLNIEKTRPTATGFKTTVKHRPSASVFNRLANASQVNPENHLNLANEEHGQRFRNSFKSFVQEYNKKKRNASLSVSAFKPRTQDEIGSNQHGPSTFARSDDPSHLPNKLGIQQ
jgi:hypothetical protein